MSDNIQLTAQAREVVGKQVKQLRNEGLIPAVLYGPGLENPLKVKISVDDLRLALRTAGGTNLISLTVDGNPINVLVREVQREVLRGEILHVDFYAVDMKAVTRAEVPVAIVGVSEVIENGLAMLITRLNTVEVECLPADIPSELELDISRLAEIGDFLTVADLKVPENVTVVTDAEDTIVRTEHATRLLTEEEEAEEAALAAEALEGLEGGDVEVIKKGREEEEDFE